jgi:hypothetical protein
MKNSGDILRFASASGFAGRPVAFGSLAGLWRLQCDQSM